MDSGKMANVNAAAVMHNGQWLKISDRDEINDLKNQNSSLNNQVSSFKDQLDSSWKLFGINNYGSEGFTFAFYRFMSNSQIEVYGSGTMGDAALLDPPGGFALNSVTWYDMQGHSIDVHYGSIYMYGGTNHAYISIDKY